MVRNRLSLPIINKFRCLEFTIEEGNLSVHDHLEMQCPNTPTSTLYGLSPGTLYTGLANGKIVSVKGKVITEIGQTGSNHCSGEEMCGRPLGLRLHNESLYVVNAYRGRRDEE